MARNQDSRKSHRGPKVSAYMSSLSPAAQINKVVVDLANLKDGSDIRNWSASARRELSPSITVNLRVLVSEDEARTLSIHENIFDLPNRDGASDEVEQKYIKVRVPKLALVAASSSFRAKIEKDPIAKNLGPFKNVTVGAVKNIAKWLFDICNKATVPELNIPVDFEDALKLRRTAWTLGIVPYVEAIDDPYVTSLDHHNPSVEKVEILMSYSRGADDIMVEACATRLSFLSRFHQISFEQEREMLDVQAQDKFAPLLDAVKGDRVLEMVERLWSTK